MLYHVSLDLVENFKLRVPESCYEGEDKAVKRICFAKTLEGAITAMPYNINILSGLLNMKKEFGVEPILHIYAIDEKDLSPKDVKDSSELVYECLVPDANITGEVWVLTDNINPRLTTVKVKDFNFNAKSFGSMAMYVVESLEYEKAAECDIVNNKKVWHQINSELKRQLNKSITPDIKRAYIASLSTFWSNK